MTDRFHVAVVGPGGGATPQQASTAHLVGALLAQAGAVVLTGGRDGVMDAACAGCASAGGLSVGILPDSDRSRAGTHCTVTLPTGLGELRNGLLVRAADAVICVALSWGTLSEVALAVRTGVPVVALEPLYLPLEGPQVARDAHDAVRSALALARARRTPRSERQSGPQLEDPGQDAIDEGR